jgi:class 3 adenylate cyclase/tetratricopeptide (TPR) repeat protein
VERKVATILFADLVGSTAFGASVDPEHARDLLDRFYDAMEAEIALGGGTVEKFIGDAVVAVFGAPAAQEDHAERALQVALWMQERMREDFSGRLALRIGVNSGEVVVGRARAGGSFATGDAVNVAARLEQAAEPGHVLVGERTAALAGGAFELGEPQTVAAKGKEGGVACRELGRMLAPRRPRGGHGLNTSFVGRRSELDRLAGMVQRTQEAGRPRLAAVVGEPGIGKTSLVRELWERLPAGTAVRIGRCLSYGRSVTYSALADILRQELGLRQEDSAEETLERLAGREILGLTLGLDVARDLEPRAALLRLQDAWVELISQIGARGPAVLVIEDLHWAADPLVEVLDRVVSDGHGPVLVLATTRPDGGVLPAAEMLALERLADEEVAELVHAALAGPVDPGVLELVTGHAEGNPFFVEELVADLLDRGLLERRDGGWSLRDGEADPGIPDSVQAVVAARIDLLPGEAKAALQAAAVVGRSFTPGDLTVLTGSSAEVRTLVERGFVRPTEPELVFKHAVTREVAYGSLPKASRARLHAAFARWVEANDPADGRAGVLAYHYAEAVAPDIAELAWRDRDDERAELSEAALRWLRRAAEVSLTRFDLDDALSHLHRAAELAPDDAGAWHAIGRVNALKFDGEAMWPAMEKAIELTEEREALAELYAELTFESTIRAGMWRRPLDHDLVESWLARALELAEAGGSVHAKALVTKALLEDDAESAQRAVVLAEQLGDPVLLSYAYWARSGLAFVGFDFHEADRWAQRRFELLDRVTDPDKIAHVLYYAAPAALAAGRPDEADTLVRRHDTVASRLSTHHEVHALAVLLFIEEALGRWEEIRKLQPRVERAVAANKATPCMLNPRALFACAVACAEIGLEADAERLEAAGVEQGFEGGVAGIWLDPPLAHLALLRGDLQRVDALLASSGALWQWTTDCSLYGIATKLDALIAVGRPSEAEALATTLLEPGTYLEPFALRTLGLVRNDPGLTERAAERLDGMGLGWHAARTRALAGAGAGRRSQPAP